MSAGRGAAGRGWLTLEQKFVKLRGYLQLNPDIDATASRTNGLTVADHTHTGGAHD